METAGAIFIFLPSEELASHAVSQQRTTGRRSNCNTLAAASRGKLKIEVEEVKGGKRNSMLAVGEKSRQGSKPS